MQIKKSSPFRMSTALLAILIFMSLITSGQSKPVGKEKVPYMWDRKNDIIFKNFKKIKKPKLYKAFNMEQPDSFYLENFGGMIEYFEEFWGERYQCLHIYLCVYKEEGSSYVPPGFANKLTLVFVPAALDTSGYTQDLGYYFFPPDRPFDPADINAFKLPDEVFKVWHNRFAKYILPTLIKTISKASDDDREDNMINDTRAITYCRLDIHELLDEQGYSHSTSDGKQPINITKDLIARFAAFGKIRNERASRMCHSQNRRRYPKRLFVQFDFTDDQKKIVSLEDTDGFCDRDDARERCEACTRGIGQNVFRGADNGQLCPPSVNCPGYKPNPNDGIK